MRIWKHLKGVFRKESYIDQNGKVDVGQLVVSSIIITIITLVLVYWEIRLLKTKQVQSYSFIPKLFDAMGYQGVALFVYLVDTFILPLTVDVMWPFVLGWKAWQAILIMALPSGLGGFTGYGIGRLIHQIPNVRKWTEINLQGKNGNVLRQYGAFGVFLAGITPIPFTTVCWFSGIFRINPKQVVIACFTSRLLRMALYYFFVAMTT